MFRLVSKDGTMFIMSIVRLILRILYRGVAISGFPSQGWGNGRMYLPFLNSNYLQKVT